jgi:chitin synthase
VVISLLITVCGLRNADPCYFRGTIPDYLFFESPPYYLLDDYLATQVGTALLRTFHIPRNTVFQI